MDKMMSFLQQLEWTEEKRQVGKIKHRMSEIVMLVLFGLLANAAYWEEIEEVAKHYEEELRKYLPLENGIPSHDTLQRVMSLIDPQITGQLSMIWKELVSQEETNKLRKLLAIDGKTMRGNGSSKQKAAHIVSAYSVEEGIIYGQTKVQEKSNEIKAVPKLLNLLEIKGFTVSADALSTQVEIAKKIREKQADYVLAVKENQKNLYEDLKYYLEFPEFQASMKEAGGYLCTEEWAHSQWEKREYYQSSDVSWLNKNQEGRWQDLRSIGMVQTTCERPDGTKTVDQRFYISSLNQEIAWFSKVVRGHWGIESLHWELDVVFREDANQTLDQTAAQNLNHLRKFSLSILKSLEMGKRYSGRRKRFKLMLELPEYLERLFRL